MRAECDMIGTDDADSSCRRGNGGTRGNSERAWRLALSHGGDILNVAVHLARLGNDVALLTAVGDDSFSKALRERWGEENLDDSLVLTLPGALPGLYAIETDARGERSFNYWRSESAARSMFSLTGTSSAIKAAEKADLLVFSLISLAILPQEGRGILLALAGRMRRAGKIVAFDGNYRPRLWSERHEARRRRDLAIACCTHGFHTLDDEQLLEGTCDAIDVARRWRATGAGEVIVKAGIDGCLLPDERWLPPPIALTPKDTSGAGDAFDAGYLDARCRGASAEDAATAGHRLAAWVIMRPGAVPARDEIAPYLASAGI